MSLRGSHHFLLSLPSLSLPISLLSSFGFLWLSLHAASFPVCCTSCTCFSRTRYVRSSSSGHLEMQVVREGRRRRPRGASRGRPSSGVLLWPGVYALVAGWLMREGRRRTMGRPRSTLARPRSMCFLYPARAAASRPRAYSKVLAFAASAGVLGQRVRPEAASRKLVRAGEMTSGRAATERPGRERGRRDARSRRPRVRNARAEVAGGGGEKCSRRRARRGRSGGRAPPTEQRPGWAREGQWMLSESQVVQLLDRRLGQRQQQSPGQIRAQGGERTRKWVAVERCGGMDVTGRIVIQ